MFKKIIKWFAIIIVGLGLLLVVTVWVTTYHPGDIDDVIVTSPADAPLLQKGQKIKILSWNIQYMAGKNYVFFYDLLDGSGPDERPSSEDITKTFNEVARIIKDESPDIILIQEIDDGAERTDDEDQLARLLTMLPETYTSHCSTFYWKAAFVPHPRVMGSVGMKLATISKYKMTKAIRHQLALIPSDWFTQQLNIKRAILETHLAVKGSEKGFVVLNTHLDAFAQGTNTMELQVQKVKSILNDLSKQNVPFLIGGDFNLLAPGKSYDRLRDSEKKYFKVKTELAPLFDLYQSVPGLKDINGPQYKKWYSHFPNGTRADGPDRTIDYLFLSKDIKILQGNVRQHDTLKISDHLPVTAEIQVP